MEAEIAVASRKRKRGKNCNDAEVPRQSPRLPFPQALWEMLQRGHGLKWSQHVPADWGDAATTDVLELSRKRFETCMPLYFNTTQFNSIVRQFCYYEVTHRWMPDKGIMLLYHPLFTRGRVSAPPLTRRMRVS